MVKFKQPEYVSGAGKAVLGLLPSQLSLQTQEVSCQQPAAQPLSLSFLAHKMGKMLFGVNGV